MCSGAAGLPDLGLHVTLEHTPQQSVCLATLTCLRGNPGPVSVAVYVRLQAYVGKVRELAAALGNTSSQGCTLLAVMMSAHVLS